MLFYLKDVNGNSTLGEANEYNGTDNNSPVSTTIVASNNSGLTFLNKNSHRLARIYSVGTDSLQITWHIWDEGDTVSDTNTTNPNLIGNASAGDSDDRSLAIVTTKVIPNIEECL